MTTCTTRTAAFTDHGIRDGTELVSRTYYALVTSGHATPEMSGEYAEHVATAFRKAFIRKAAVPLVPEPVEAAIEASTDIVVHRLLDDSDADLRTEVLPAYYRAVANAYCAHLAAGGNPGRVGVWYHDDDDDDGGIPVTPT